jgi:hypothetical protein
MTTQAFQAGADEIANNGVPADIRVALLMTNTTAGDVGSHDYNTQGAWSAGDLDEFDGSGYVGVFDGNSPKELAGETITRDDANDHIEIDGTDTVFATLGAGTRSIAGALILKYNATRANSIPLCWCELASPIAANGGNITLQWNADGLFKITT